MKSPFDPIFVELLVSSHARFVGAPLVDANLSADAAARWLYEDAPFCVLAHNTDPDPRFIYANRAAQRCFEYSWEEFIGFPSRLSAETPNQEERQRLLDAVARDGFATGYRGLRIARSGRRFWIEDVTVWNLVDAAGVLHGQAATYRRWRDA
jgi:PAS domain-containing protein